MVCGGWEPDGGSCASSMESDDPGGGSSILVERLPRRTGRGTSTLGFNDCRD